MAISGLGVTYVISGIVIFWSGFTNNSIADTLKGFLEGAVPVHQPMAPPSIGVNNNASGSSTGGFGGSSGGSGAPVSDSQIANDALKYSGHAYRYGGAPGPSGNSPWDCSSFVNWVLGHDLGHAIPGYAAGKWNPNTHGPATGDYLLWGGAKTISHNSKDAQAGDLCVWQTHMGIAIGGGKMISALNERLGTQVTGIDGIVSGEMLFVRRVS